MAPVTRHPSQSGRSGLWLAGMGLLCSIAVALLSACDDPQTPPAPTDITTSAATATSNPEPTPTATPNLTAEPTATSTPTPTPANTPTPSPTVTPLPLSAKEVLDAAIAAVKGAHSGHIESEFTLEAEIEETKLVLSTSVVGDFHTPDRAHLSGTYSIQGLPSVDIDGAKVDIGSQSWTEEWIIVGDDVYVRHSIGGDSRHTRDSIELPFDLSFLFEFDLLDSDGEISTNEQELDGERVYYVTGPPAQDSRYPLLDGAHSIDGVVDYWIGAEDHLLRRLEISVVSVGLTRDAETQRLNGFVTLSDYGKTVDIRPPALEGADDHGNSPANSTEISVGESVNASVDSWIDSDYFRFQAEEGRLYHIVVSDERAYNKASDSHSTLFGPDGVTPEAPFSRSSGQRWYSDRVAGASL